MLSAKEHAKKEVIVKGKTMSYVEMGEGDPVIFQHGNPTSSYLWRNVMPHLQDQGRCIAIDLIGMGDSDKLDNPDASSYTFVQHREYLDGALEALGIESDVTLVIHDWGSALAFDWASKHDHRVQGIVYMEAIVDVMMWDDWPENARKVFQAFRSPAGEEMILNKNIFVETPLLINPVSYTHLRAHET